MMAICFCGEPHHTEADYELAHGDRDYALYLLEEQDHEQWFDGLAESFDALNEDRVDAFLDAMGVSAPVVRPALRPTMGPGELALLWSAAGMSAASLVLSVSTAAVVAAALLALS